MSVEFSHACLFAIWGGWSSYLVCYMGRVEQLSCLLYGEGGAVILFAIWGGWSSYLVCYMGRVEQLSCLLYGESGAVILFAIWGGWSSYLPHFSKSYYNEVMYFSANYYYIGIYIAPDSN